MPDKPSPSLPRVSIMNLRVQLHAVQPADTAVARLARTPATAARTSVRSATSTIVSPSLLPLLHPEGLLRGEERGGEWSGVTVGGRAAEWIASGGWGEGKRELHRGLGVSDSGSCAARGGRRGSGGGGLVRRSGEERTRAPPPPGLAPTLLRYCVAILSAMLSAP